MNKFLSLVLLVAVLGVRKSTSSVPLSEFFPYGANHGDHMVPTADDNFVEHDLSSGHDIYFFNQAYNKIFVNNNGGVSFVRGTPAFTPTCGSQNTPMIIPFWADVDTNNGGAVWYRESTEPEILAKATTETLTAYPGLASTLHINRVFIVTWDDVAFFGSANCGPESQARRNNFQTIIATDGHMSFIIFNYERVNWMTGTASGGDCNGRGGTPAKAGFDTGDNVNFFSLPGSCTEEIENVLTTTNVLQPGKWIFRVDQETIEDPQEPEPEPITEEPVEDEVIEQPGQCDPNDCSLKGYCYTYAKCDHETREFRTNLCSHGLYWNPHNPEAFAYFLTMPIPVISAAGRRALIKQTKQMDHHDHTENYHHEGGHTDYYHDIAHTEYPAYGGEGNGTDYPHMPVDACHGNCDVWDNLPHEIQQIYLHDENCFPKCTYEAVAECENRYVFHAHNTDAREVEYIHCPTDTRHGNHVPMVWVQERETCDFCYNAYRTDYNGTFEPCCERYDGLGNDTDFQVDETTSDNHHDFGYDHHFTGAPEDHNNAYDDHFNGAPAEHNNEYDSHFNGVDYGYDSHFNGAPAYHNEYDSHFNGAPAYHNEYDNHFNGAPAPAHHSEYDSHFNGAPEWNAPGGYDYYHDATPPERSLHQSKTFDLKRKI